MSHLRILPALLCILVAALLAPIGAAAQSCPDQDIVVLLDGSGSLGSTNWETLEDTAEGFVSGGLSPVPEDTRFGAIKYSTLVDAVIPLSYDEASVTGLIDALTYTGGWTNTLDALQEAIDMFDANPSGSQKILILATDGNPTVPGGPQNVCVLESGLKSRGIKTLLYAVGFGVTQATLDCLVDDPDEDYYVFIDYQELQNEWIDSYTGRFCTAAVPSSSPVGIAWLAIALLASGTLLLVRGRRSA